MTQFAIMGDEYAPLPSLMWKGEYIHVFGEVWYYNMTHSIGGSTSEYPAPNISVRIFATEELSSEIVITNETGYFMSVSKYEAGQILTITIGNSRYESFISYTEQDDFWLGRFYIEI